MNDNIENCDFAIIHLGVSGFATIIDLEDYDRVAQFNWYAVYDHKKVYAGRHYYRSPIDKKDRTMQKLHRFLLPDCTARYIDHIDGDGLNNRKSNLRPATHAQNMANSGPRMKNTSGYKGVSWCKRKKKWHVTIRCNHKTINIGYFIDIIEAALAYDKVARERQGEFAWTNFPEQPTLEKSNEGDGIRR